MANPFISPLKTKMAGWKITIFIFFTSSWPKFLVTGAAGTGAGAPAPKVPVAKAPEVREDGMARWWDKGETRGPPKMEVIQNVWYQKLWNNKNMTIYLSNLI